MTIYLDYHIQNKELHSIGIKEESNTPIILTDTRLNNVIDYLIGNEEIVVFGKPYYIIKNNLIGMEHLLKDAEISNRWTDIKLMIRKSSGLNTSISKINEAMWGKEEKLTRLEQAYTNYDNFKLEQKMKETLNSLERIWNIIQDTGQIGFVKNYKTIWIDINVNQYTRDDSV